MESRQRTTTRAHVSTWIDRKIQVSRRRGSTISTRSSFYTTATRTRILAPFLLVLVLIWLRCIRHYETYRYHTASLSSPLTTNTNITTIAYVISLIKCSDFQSSTVGLLDAATILRHSIHLQSHRVISSSKYDYTLIALVHKQAQQCSQPLQDLGYNLHIVDSPVIQQEIRGEFLRNNVGKEWCCGIEEFIKLYAYTLVEYPVVVLSDTDFVYYRPMDRLYDAMLWRDGINGKKRVDLELEYPERSSFLPDKIDAFFTRDYHQVIPGRKAAVQAGFFVLRPNRTTFHEYLEIIREGNFIGGYSRENGWGGKGYGGVVGSMAMQGLPAYYYDVIRPNTSVELNGCRYNHMGANVFYENVPNFIKKYKDLHGKCRRNVEGCEDCRMTDVENVYNFHLTNCRKPWNCAGTKGTSKGQIDPRTTDFEHCKKVIRKWHEIRTDLEEKIMLYTRNISILEGRKGNYMKDIFMGHCDEDGQSGYRVVSVSREILLEIAEKLWG